MSPPAHYTIFYDEYLHLILLLIMHAITQIPHRYLYALKRPDVSTFNYLMYTCCIYIINYFVPSIYTKFILPAGVRFIVNY